MPAHNGVMSYWELEAHLEETRVLIRDEIRAIEIAADTSVSLGNPEVARVLRRAALRLTGMLGREI